MATPTEALFSGTTEAVEGGEVVDTVGARAAWASALGALGGPRRLARATLHLGADVARIAAGRSDIAPPPKDWRFVDPAWRDHPLYRRLGQSYLAWADAVLGLVDDDDSDWRAAERARFALTILTTAAAPTNFLPTNPAALKRAFETGGASVLRGARNMVRDLATNGGMPSQVDRRTFRLGETIAVSPGAVVHRDELCEIIQYRPTTPQVAERPVLVVPPQINKYYFLDLAPGRSFVEYALGRGLQVFMVSWRNPGKEQAGKGLDDYGRSILDAVDVARAVTGSDDVNLLSFCAGGTSSAGVLSHLAATDDERVATASFAVTLLDFDIRAMIGMLASPSLLGVAKWNSRRKGVLDGAALARIFTWFRPNDLVWNYWVNNYLLGEDPPAFDILAWNADPTNLPAELHRQFLDIFADRLLCTPGAMTVLGSPIDLTRVKIESYVTGAVGDHLTPWQGCYRTTQLLGGDSTFVLSYGGHIQALVNPPGNPKAYYLTGPDPGPDPEEWSAGATRHEGTWWEHWSAWALQRSGAPRPAPRRLGSRSHPAMEPAPGTYVHVRL